MHLSIPQIAAGSAVVLAGYPLGWRLVRHVLPDREPLLSTLLACAVGLGVLSTIDLATTAVGAYKNSVLVLLTCILAAVGALIIFVRSFRRGLPLLVVKRWSVTTNMLVGLLLLVLVISAGGALAPETQYDALRYHLGFPIAWLQTGHLTFFPWQFVSAYPFTVELLYGNAIALAGPIAAKVVNLTYGVLLVGVTVDMGRRIVGLRAALLGAIALAVSPVVVWEMSTANVDLATAAYIVLAIDVAIVRVKRPDRRTAILAGLLMGLAMATHFTAAFALPALMGLIVLLPPGRSAIDRLLDVALVAVMTLLPSLPYLIRAEILTNNPLFPYLYGLFGAKSSLWNQRANVGLDRQLRLYGDGHGILRLLLLPWDLTVHPNKFAGGFGVLLMFGVLLWVVQCLARGRTRVPRIQGLVFAGAIVNVVLWFWPGGTLQGRFLVPAGALLAPFAGAALLEGVTALGAVHNRFPACHAVTRLRRPLVASGALACVAAAVLSPFIGHQGYDAYGSVQDALQGWHYVRGESRADYLTRYVPTYGAELALDRVARPDSRVLTFADADLDQVDAPVPHIPFFAVQVAGVTHGARQLAADLVHLHVGYVLWQRDLLNRGYMAQQRQFTRQYLHLVYSGPTSLLYRFEP